MWMGSGVNNYCIQCNVESDVYVDNVTFNQQNNAVRATNGARV